MRNPEVLDVIHKSGLIKTWLYQDETRSVTFVQQLHFGPEFAIDLDVVLKMDDDGAVIAKLGEAEDFQPYDEQLDHQMWSEIIRQLGTQQSVNPIHPSMLHQIISETTAA